MAEILRIWFKTLYNQSIIVGGKVHNVTVNELTKHQEPEKYGLSNCSRIINW